MRYLVRQKVFSIRDSFTIKDEYGNDVFKVFGRLLSIGNKLTLTDLLDQELYYIEQRLFRFLPEYTIYRNGRPVATVKKNLTLFRPSFDISSVYGSFNIDGSFWAYDFTVFKNGSPAAIVSKKWFSFSDSYGVSISDGEDAAFMLALVIVLDMVYHNDNN